jgi:hypothetical protein
VLFLDLVFVLVLLVLVLVLDGREVMLEESASACCPVRLSWRESRIHVLLLRCM